MIIKPELVKRTKDYFDLNIYEAKVWLALLTRGIASAGEIAELSGVPRSRTYDVLESLEKRGFAIVKIGKPVKYISVKPTEVIEKMKSKAMTDANEKVQVLGNLKSTPEYAELEQLHVTGIVPIKSCDLTGSFKGRSQIISRVRELLENANKEVFICTSVADFEDKSRVLNQSIESLVKRNIKVKIALSGDVDKIKKLNAKLPVKAKIVDSSARFFVSDKKEMMFMITPENVEEEMGVWLNSELFSGSITSMFEQVLKAYGN
ncbi:MAG: helix-turn-helix domain-containing protein [archaeon]